VCGGESEMEQGQLNPKVKKASTWCATTIYESNPPPVQYKLPARIDLDLFECNEEIRVL
jgi:hypothetical protein